jgi:ABC-type Na+ efflux pump permease subunit
VIPGPSLDDNPVAWREWHRMRPSGMMWAAWGLYAALGVLWFGLALSRSGPPRRMLAEEQGMMVGFQVALGLLLISVNAATSLAEERVRGSLDVLLSTPMSTRSILAGKWWGTFRQVGPVAFWPALLGGRMLLIGGSLFHYLLLVGSVVVYGAAITSLGLALATWVSRLGRAVASCVTVYVAFSVGWTIVIVLLFSPHPLGRPLVIGSPAIGAFAGMAMISPDYFPSGREEYLAGAALWLLAYVAAASGLFAATVASFDRCLGRMPEDDEPPRATEGEGRNGATDEHG